MRRQASEPAACAPLTSRCVAPFRPVARGRAALMAMRGGTSVRADLYPLYSQQSNMRTLCSCISSVTRNRPRPRRTRRPMNVDARYRLGWIAVALLFCLAAALLYVDFVRFRAGTGVAYGRAAIGAPAPDVLLVTLDGHARRLSTFFGRPLVVNFFATWCEPCKAELPLVESRYVAARASGLTVLGVDQQEGPHEVRAFAAAHGVTYPIVI